MLDDELAAGSDSTEAATPQSDAVAPVVKKTVRRRTTKKVAAPEVAPAESPVAENDPAQAQAQAQVPAQVQAEAPDAAVEPVVKKTTRKRATKKVAATPVVEAVADEADDASFEVAAEVPAEAAPKKRPARKKAAAKKAAPAAAAEPAAGADEELPLDVVEPVEKPKRRRKKAEPVQVAEVTEQSGDESAPEEPAVAEPTPEAPTDAPVVEEKPAKKGRKRKKAATDEGEASVAAPLFQAPGSAEVTAVAEETAGEAADRPIDGAGDEPGERDSSDDAESGEDSGGAGRRRRRRGGRRRRKGNDNDSDQDSSSDDAPAGAKTEASAEPASADATNESSGESTSSRRRRRRRRAGEDGDGGGDDPAKTVTKVRRARSAEDEITAVSGSTRLEAKKQRRREGREAGRRRAPIVSEAEFLARRESVDRVMAIRQRDDVTQIAVLEDKVLVEHYVARESQTSLIGNVYLGRVQNVLPSMEAAFIDIGKGRNAVLYAGEVNWQALGHKEGEPRKIESVLSSGQAILVQVTKDPVGQKGARLTSQVSLAGRFLVYVPDGTTSGISRKLPDTERARLKTLLKEVVPDSAGVIVRTAAEGAAEDELRRDVERLRARWEDIEKKIAKGNSPQLLYGEPDLTLKVVRDLFTEDFARLVIDGEVAWETVHEYVAHVAPDLKERLEKHDPEDARTGGRDLFAHLRIDEQIHKGLDRKVWLPSGGSLIIDRTEAMTVIDVNTGKFTGSGGNLEETVTKNNLESAEEIVRQLRLRDIGGIIVVDFIDMVLESNRDLVLRRLVECLGRDRTRHQVAEVTSLGLVQMTRKRIGTGLLEAFSENCEHCQGRGLVLHDAPIEPRRGAEESGAKSRRGRRSRGGESGGNADSGAANNGGARNGGGAKPAPSPRDIALMARTPEPEPEPVSAAAAIETLADTEADAVDVPTSEPAETATPVAEPSPDVVEAPDRAESAAPEAVEAVEAPAPKVTRGRRRAATRPAGPPATTDNEADVPVEQPADETSTSEKATIEHVPIKKRGTRKR